MPDANPPMTRSEAIRKIISHIQQLDHEFGPTGRVNEEATEVLTALGVTPEELATHLNGPHRA